MAHLPFKGLLFDLDGTLVDSIPAVIRSWTLWAKTKGLDPDYVLSRIHGRPAKESITELLGGATEEQINVEFAWLEHQESADTEGTVPLPGSIALLEELNRLSIPWAIVTSGTRPVATARIKAAGIPMPKTLITPELITQGKPHPEPYLKGASSLGLPIEQCICFEDTGAGIQSAKSAQATAIAVLSHATKEDLPEADFHIPDHLQLKLSVSKPGEFSLELHVTE